MTYFAQSPFDPEPTERSALEQELDRPIMRLLFRVFVVELLIIGLAFAAIHLSPAASPVPRQDSKRASAVDAGKRDGASHG